MLSTDAGEVHSIYRLDAVYAIFAMGFDGHDIFMREYISIHVYDVRCHFNKYHRVIDQNNGNHLKCSSGCACRHRTSRR